jgi:polar amino acid transport system substrate-binding protein
MAQRVQLKEGPIMRMLNKTFLSLLALSAAGLAAPAAQAATLDRIKGAGVINFGYVDGLPPFSVTNDEKTAAGYSIDLCNHVADLVKEKLGLPQLEVRFVPIAANDAAAQLANGGIDLVCTAASDTLERRQNVSFSIPVFNGGIGVLVRQDADEPLMNVLSGKVAVEGPKWRGAINGGLANKTFVVAKSSASESWVRQQIARLGVVATVIEIDDPVKGVELLNNHEADAYFGDRTMLAGYAAQPENAPNLMVVDRTYTYEPLALALARNDDDFRLLVDTALSQVFTGARIGELYTKYFGAFDDNTKRLFLGYARN